MFEWVQWALDLVLPSRRWKKRLEADLAIYQALPKGEARRAYKRQVTAQAVRLDDYQNHFPAFQKGIGWFTVMVGGFMIVNWASLGPAKTIDGMASEYGVGWPIIAVMSLATVAVGGMNTIRGRNIVGQTPRQFEAYIDAERDRNERARLQRVLRRRARRAFR